MTATTRLLLNEKGTMVLMDLPPSATRELRDRLAIAEPATVRVMLEVEPGAHLQDRDQVQATLKLSFDHGTWSPPLAVVFLRTAELYDA